MYVWKITVWCDKKVDSTGAKHTSDANEDGPVTKRAKMQVAIKEVKKELVEKHANKFSETQYKLWVLMVSSMDSKEHVLCTFRSMH